MFVLLFCFKQLPRASCNLQQQGFLKPARLTGKSVDNIQGQFLDHFGWPLVQYASFGLAGEKTGVALGALVVVLDVGGAGETSMLILFVKTHLALVLSAEGVGVEAALQEDFAGSLARRKVAKQSVSLELADALIESLNDLFFAGEMVVNDTGAGPGAQSHERHGSVMESAFHNDVKHRIEYGVTLRRF